MLNPKCSRDRRCRSDGPGLGGRTPGSQARLEAPPSHPLDELLGPDALLASYNWVPSWPACLGFPGWWGLESTFGLSQG